MKKFLSFCLTKIFLVITVLSIPLLTFAANGHGLTDVAKKTGLYSAETNIGLIISKIIVLILGFLGLIMVILIIIAGFQWMTAGGNSETIKKAKERITSAIIGLIIIFLSLSISYFVIENLKEILGVGSIW